MKLLAINHNVYPRESSAHDTIPGGKAVVSFLQKLILPARILALTLVLLFLASLAEAATRTWAGGLGTGKDWTLASNWAEGSAPGTGDDIVFSNNSFDGAITFSIMPASNVNYNSLTITRGIIILANTGTSITLTIGGNAGTDLFINSSRSLRLESNVSITLAANSTATISGTMEIKNGAIYNTGSMGAVTTVTGTGTIYNYGDMVNDPRDPYNPSAVISTSASNLIFNSGSSYQHLREGSAIPKATWATTSTCLIQFTVPFKIERVGNGIPPDPASFAQQFGNLTWDCDQFYTAMSLAPYLTTVKGNLEIRKTGVAAVGHTFPILQLTNSPTDTLTIGGTLKVYSMVNFDGGTINAGSTTVYRNIKNTSAILTVNSGTALTLASLTIGPYVAYTGDGAPNCPDCSELLTFNPQGGTVTINGDVTIYPSCALACKTSPVIYIKGNLSNNGSFVKDHELVSFIGNIAKFINGTSVTTFYNLDINNSAGVTLQSDARVWNTLSFTNGKITTGANTLTLDVNATPISGAAAGRYVNGNLGISIPPNTTSKTFTIGDATNYTPVTLTFGGTPTNSIGNIIASTKNVVHPNIATTGIYGIDATKSLNRYFTLTNNGTTFGTYSAAFTFINPTDLLGSADPMIFMVQRFSPNSWFSTNIGTRTTTTTQVTGLTQTDFGDFQAGQMKCTPPVNTYTVTGGGSYCGENTGSAIGLSGSEAGVLYQLRVNGVNTGTPVPGGGSSISFVNQSAPGSYTVLASRVLGGCYSTMNNSVTIP